MTLQKLVHEHNNIGDNHERKENYSLFSDTLPLAIRILYHSLIISLYIFCEVLFTTINGSKAALIAYLPFYVIDIFFFYLNGHINLPLSFKYRKSIWAPILLSAVLLASHFLLLISFTNLPVTGFKNIFIKDNLAITVSYIWRVVFIFGLSAFYWNARFTVKQLRREKVLENAYLHSRISPHMIFNCMNFIHSSVQGISTKAGEMIELLSEYARYAMTEFSPDGKTSLGGEISQLNRLFKMALLRYGVVHLDMNISIDDDKLRLPSHIIPTLAENLFKYGDVEDSEFPAKINIWNERKRLHLIFINKKIGHVETVSHKIGIQNIVTRLQNLYGRKFKLRIDDKPDYFNLELTLVL